VPFVVVWHGFVSCQVKGRQYDLDLWLVCTIVEFDICGLVDVGLANIGDRERGWTYHQKRDDDRNDSIK
jgi:hypothetical protein